MNDFNFKKSLGQNFLIDDNIKRKIVDAASIEEDSIIIEVGPGSGAITKLLVQKGVPVIAFEIDTRLRSELDKIDSDNFHVIYEDFLKVNLSEVLKDYSYKKIHLIANLPYYITTPIITKVMEETEVDEMIVMVQKEVGDRFYSKSGTKEYNSLSVFLQYYFDISRVTLVSKNCFVPKPKVDSVVVKFVKKTNKYEVNDEKVFFKLVRDAFQYKRKNLRNNLKNYDLEKIDSILKTFGKDLTYRAEQLTIDEFVKLANNI